MDPHQAQSTLEQFAAFLVERQEEITAEWMSGVHADGRVQTSERLSAGELKAHLPQLFENLADLLRSPADFEAKKDAGDNARTHGALRFEQGYRVDELLREMARIRGILIVQTLGFEEQNPAFAGVVKRVALQRLHGFFDDLICDSAVQFVRDQQVDLREDVSVARAHANEAHQGRSAAREDVQKLQEVDATRLRLLRTVAHELRNNVNTAQLIAHELKDESDASAQRELLAILTRSISHLGELLKDLLEYALLLEKTKAPRMESVNVAEFGEDLLTGYGALAEAKGLEMKMECDPALVTVASDRTKLVQIATNLLSNAVKYTAKGQVTCWMRALDAKRWSLGVEDTGAGFALEDFPGLFGEFNRAEGTAHMEGTGLGLSIVKRLAELLEGEVLVESKLGQGSRFEVILPRTGVRSEAFSG